VLAASIIENVLQNVQNVQHVTAAKPILSDMIAAGKIKVAGGVYDIATGKVSLV
jgi:carbonic anhydrase